MTHACNTSDRQGPETKPRLIAIDWGSSNFRAFLMDERGQLLDSLQTNQGFLSLNSEQFESILFDNISHWLLADKLPVLMCGMVGSQKGWVATDYLPCPCTVSQLAYQLRWVDNSKGLSIGIVPGIEGNSFSQQPDVMRGEEVQIFGACHSLNNQLEAYSMHVTDKALFCLPGTHSKWVTLNINTTTPSSICNLATYMSGEVFDLLNNNSILSSINNVGCDIKKESTIPSPSFDLGLKTARSTDGFIHQIFSARTYLLQGILTEQQVESYLSGLILGCEIYQMKQHLDFDTVYLIGNEHLNTIYQHALQSIDVKAIVIDGQMAAYSGLFVIAQNAQLIVKNSGNEHGKR